VWDVAEFSAQSRRERTALHLLRAREPISISELQNIIQGRYQEMLVQTDSV